MRQIFIFLMTVSCVMICVRSEAEDEQELERFHAEIRGTLRQLESSEKAGVPEAYVVTSKGIEVVLNWKDGEQPKSLDSLKGHVVDVSGELSMASGKTLVCRVTRKIRAVYLTQYLVGYKSSHVGAVRKAMVELGIRIKEDYKPGKYLIAVATGEIEKASIDRLRKTVGVRFVELNQKVSIKPPDSSKTDAPESRGE